MANIQAKIDFVSSPGWDKHRMIEALMAFTDNPSATNFNKLNQLMLKYQDESTELAAIAESLRSLGER